VNIIDAAAQSTSAGEISATTGIITAIILLITAVLGLWQVRRLRGQANDTNRRLTVIHDLVNHTLTESLQSDLEGTQLALGTMAEMVALHERDGAQARPETVAAMDTASAKISRLTLELAERMSVAKAIVSELGPDATEIPKEKL
jgi:hypothetical protein